MWHQIQTKYVDTKHQLADILRKGNFTRDEWNNHFHLLNVRHCSLFCCSQNISLTSCIETMAKRMQEQEEERIVAKSKPTMNLVSLVSTNSSTVQNPTASKSPEILTAPCRKDWSNTRKFEAKITQSRRSVEFPRMAKGCATVHKHRETCSNRQGSEISESSGEICHKHRGTCSN